MATTKYRLTLRGQFPRVIPQNVTFEKRNLNVATIHSERIFAARNRALLPGKRYTSWELVRLDALGKVVGEPCARGPRA